MESLQGIPVLLIAGIAVFIAIIAFAASRYKVAKPNEAIIIAGSRQEGGTRVVIGGGTIVYPLINVAKRISLEIKSISVGLSGSVTKQGVPVSVEGIVNVKIADDENSIRQAAQRFLDSQTSIDDVVRNVMEGSLRTIIGQMSVEELIQDREAFSQRVQEVATQDLQGTGLVLDVFTIQSILDSEDYIKNMGRAAASEVRKHAEIAEANNNREAREQQELARQQVLEAEKSTKLKEQAIAQEVATATAKAEQAQPLAEAEARKAVVLQETEVADLTAKRREKELDSEIRKKADADLYATQQKAEGSRYERVAAAEASAKATEVAAAAEATQERTVGLARAEAIKAIGSAEADAMAEKADAYDRYGEAAVTEMLVSRLPEIAKALADPLANVDSITVIDTAGASKLTESVVSNFSQLDAIVNAMTGKKLVDFVGKREGADPKGLTS